MYGSREGHFFWASSARVHSDSRRSSSTVADGRRSSPTVADQRQKNSRNKEKVHWATILNSRKTVPLDGKQCDIVLVIILCDRASMFTVNHQRDRLATV